MNESFKKRQVLFMVQLAVVAAVLYMLHAYLLNALFVGQVFIIPLNKVYVFHAISVLIVYTIINFRFSNGKTQVFNAFILLMVLKMAVVIVFLLPLILSDTQNKVADAINFFIPYFLFLGFEVYSINQFLNPK